VPRRANRVRIWLAWFAALNVLWLALISAFVLEETILGLFASAIAATAAEVVREQGLTGFKPRLRWFLHARSLPWRTVRETGWVLAALWSALFRRRPVRGRFRVIPVTFPDDPDEAAAKRGLLVAGEGFAPNTYALGFDEARGLMLIHELVARDE
jgi:multisubunit Na+/H+ antiporter MnhE subunit